MADQFLLIILSATKNDKLPLQSSLIFIGDYKMLTLYYAPGACSMASHIALLENDLKFQLKKVNMQSHTTEDGKDFYTINPNGYIPSLQTETGQTLSEGAAILFYISEQSHKNPPMNTSDTFAKYRLQEWLTFISSELHKTLGAFFNKSLPNEYKKALAEKFSKRMNYLESVLSKSKFLLGEQFSVADAYCFTILNWLHNLETGLQLNDWPHIKAYQNAIATRPAVKAAMIAEGLL